VVNEPLRYQVRIPGLPLAVYREIAAHLRQVQGVDASLTPQTSQQFDYNQSQVGSLSICQSDACDLAERERVRQILEYYQNRYGAWKEDTSQIVP
jgi:hypothetical protein